MKRTPSAVIALLALAFTAAPSFASDATTTSPLQVHEVRGDVKTGQDERINFCQVGLVVDVPGSRLYFRNHLQVPEGSTVSQALESVYTVKHGIVCCDSRDIWAINGLAVDPYKQKWWIIKVNGNAQNASSTTKLKDGDLVELSYKEDAFYPVAHLRLEEWVSNIQKKKE